MSACLNEAPAPDEASDVEAQRARLAAVLRKGIGDLTAARGAPHPAKLAVALAEQLAAIESPKPAGPTAKRVTMRDVIAQWRKDGPLIHEPTGLAELDAAIDGGPVYGTRIYANGAPDAGKTLFNVQLAHTWIARGLCVGILAFDEEASDITTRLLQRLGWDRRACEMREPGALDRMEGQASDARLAMYGPGSTIESAAADLAAWAKSLDTRAALFVDSLQTVPCAAELMTEREMGGEQKIAARVHAVRTVATEHKLIAIVSSEMNRGGYRSEKVADQINPMAAGKGSGAIEYSARIALSFKSVPGESDLIRMEIVKNKHGRARLAIEGEALYLRLDRARQTLEECEAPEGANEDERDAARAARATEQTLGDAAVLAAVLAARPGLSSRDLRAAARARAGTCSSDRVATAVALLGDAIVCVNGPARSRLHYLDGGRLDADVMKRIGGNDRTAVIMARPPAGGADA